MFQSQMSIEQAFEKFYLMFAQYLPALDGLREILAVGNSRKLARCESFSKVCLPLTMGEEGTKVFGQKIPQVSSPLTTGHGKVVTTNHARRIHFIIVARNLTNRKMLLERTHSKEMTVNLTFENFYQRRLQSPMRFFYFHARDRCEIGRA